jgi:hypothetical protein
MGVVYVALQNCVDNEQPLWYPFQARRTRKDKVSGDVQLIVKYEPNQQYRAKACMSICSTLSLSLSLSLSQLSHLISL